MAGRPGAGVDGGVSTAGGGVTFGSAQGAGSTTIRSIPPAWYRSHASASLSASTTSKPAGAPQGLEVAPPTRTSSENAG